MIVSPQLEAYYESVLRKLREDFLHSSFWTSLKSQEAALAQKYEVDTGYHLFAQEAPKTILTKPFSSVLDKTFRKNVVSNANWPNPPQNGWVTPDDPFSGLNDILRCTYVVKYLDAVDYFVSELTRLGSGLAPRIDMEAKDVGYYAAHFYATIPFHIPAKNWDTREVRVTVEIQVTTQLQEVIRKLLHKHYSGNRSNTPKESERPWQWNYDKPEFSTNYLGHILHYIEGTILEVRKKQKSNDES